MSMYLSVVGQAVLVSVLIAMLAGWFVKDLRKLKTIVAVGVILCMLIPVNSLTVAQWLRSVAGDLSVLTLLILSNILMQRLYIFNLINPLSRQILLWGIMLVGIVFYPLALGLGSIDPYHWGYAPLLMGISLTVASVFSWFKGSRDLAVILLLPLLAFNFKLLESVNLWDYLLDPVLLIYAVVQNTAYIKFARYKKQGV